MGNSQVESAAEHGPAIFEDIIAAEIMPQAQGDGGQLKAASAAAVVDHGIIAGF